MSSYQVFERVSLQPNIVFGLHELHCFSSWVKNSAFHPTETGSLKKQEQSSKLKDKLMLRIVFSSQQANQAKSWMVANVVRAVGQAWCKSYLIFALLSGISSPNLNHILTQPVKHNTLCSTAVQESMENCCFVADMHRSTIRHSLSSQVQFCVTQNLTAALSQVCIWACLGWCWPFNICPPADMRFPTCTALGPDLQWAWWLSPHRGEVLRTSSSFLASWDSKTFITTGNYTTFGKP